MQSSEPAKRSAKLSRAWDVLAVLVVALALWKIFLAPRSLNAPRAFPAPHAVYGQLEGGTFRLAEQRGRIVFMDFYASWCEPCKLELPLVEGWSRKHPEAVVVPVDVGESRSIAQSFAQRFGLNGVALDPHSSARALFGIEGFPTVVVIDPEGYVRGKWEGLNPAIELAMSNAALRLRTGQAR
ncbi:MAG TPA: TlpA disulfide reductase family protein [Candidatus Cybelea sp.]|nr:TlpA disulfide reductase family protein [Candidatus Cybelea sp.]